MYSLRENKFYNKNSYFCNTDSVCMLSFKKTFSCLIYLETSCMYKYMCKYKFIYYTCFFLEKHQVSLFITSCLS